jgi:hypothetical protein
LPCHFWRGHGAGQEALQVRTPSPPAMYGTSPTLTCMHCSVCRSTHQGAAAGDDGKVAEGGGQSPHLADQCAVRLYELARGCGAARHGAPLGALHGTFSQGRQAGSSDGLAAKVDAAGRHARHQPPDAGPGRFTQCKENATDASTIAAAEHAEGSAAGTLSDWHQRCGWPRRLPWLPVRRVSAAGFQGCAQRTHIS